MWSVRKVSVWLATVAGLGRAPVAPGTWGSLIGLGAGVLTLRIGSPAPLWLLLPVKFAVCAWLAGLAERELDRHDPPEIIIDEVWGMAVIPIAVPAIAASAWGLLAAFLLFRAFDIVKPPPLKALSRLPGGWGIMADDAGAAAYTALLLWLWLRFMA